MVTVESGGKQVKRWCYIVDSICNLITHWMQALFGNGLFVPSSTCSLHSDNVIMVRFGGDKGGKFMQFKFGLSIMNCPHLNSADAFDILATLDAFYTYTNLQEAIFQKLDGELQQLFSEKFPPSMPVVKDSTGTCISCLVICKKYKGPSPKPLADRAAWDSVTLQESGMICLETGQFLGVC